MEGVDLEWLESVVKAKHGVSKLLSAEAKLAVSDGDNYVSRIYRLTLETLSDENRPKQISLILKSKLDLEIEDNKELTEKLNDVFNKEYLVYTDILVKLQRYLPKNEVTLWADCLSYIPNKAIYFEDLKASGHELAKRMDGLDFDHSLLAFKNFAKLHAASVIALEKGEIDICPYRKYIIVQAAPGAKKIKSNSYAMMVDVIRKDWGPEWDSLADRLEKVVDTLPDQVCDVGQLDKKRPNVFNHGDTWVNNMMFKYDSNNKPIALKFIDFQLSHYNSYGLDLCYFLSTSVNPENKLKYLDSWIKAYCDTFSACLDEQESSFTRLTPDMVKKELVRLAPLSLNISIRIRPIIMAPPEDAIPLSELMKDTGFNSRKRRLFTNPVYTTVMKKDIPYLLDILNLN